MAAPSFTKPESSDMTRMAARVGVVGCGHWGKNLIRNFAELGALGAVSDADEALAAKYAEEHHTTPKPWNEILASPAIEAVVIAAPAAVHARLAHEAIEAGKHVYIEKPLALDVVEAEAIVRKAGDAKRTLMVGHLLQYHPAYVKLREMVRGGELGRLRYVYSNRLSLGKIRREEDVLWSFAPHDISMILGLTGEEPCEVDGKLSPLLHDRIADTAHVHLGFPSGVKAHVSVSWLHPFKEHRLVVIGDRAMTVFDDTQPWPSKVVLYRHMIGWRDEIPAPVKAEGEPVEIGEAEPLKEECRHFLECVRTGREPQTNGEEGLAVLRVLRAASRSAKPAGETAGRFSDVSIHESAYIDEPVEIGAGTKIWHFSHVLPHVRIGRNCSIGQNVVVGPNVTVGDNCRIQNNVSVYDGVTLEDGVFCGPSCVFTNVNNPRSEIERKDEFRKTIVKRGASIGANATVVCGNVLGAYSFIAAGATVTKDVPDFALMAGVPARRIGWMSKAGARLGLDLVCPIDGTKYRETADGWLEEVVV